MRFLRGLPSKAPEFPDCDGARLGSDQIARGIRRVITAEAIVIGIGFENILGAGGIVLERGEGLNEAGTARMDEEPGAYGGGRVAETLEDFGPAIDPVCVGTAELNTEISVFFCNSEAIALAGEDIGTGDEAFQDESGLSLGRFGELDAMTVKHGLDGLGVTFNDPVSRSVLIHDVKIAVTVGAAEQSDRVMVETVVEGSEPLDPTAIGEVVQDMHLAAEVGEELAGGDVPVAVAPGAFLPTGQIVQDIAVFRIGERVVVDCSGDEPGGGFGSVEEGYNIGGTVPGVTDAAGVGGGIDAWTPGEAVGRDV